MNVKNVLGDIETDYANLRHGRLPLSGAEHIHFGTSMPSAGRPPHHKSVVSASDAARSVLRSEADTLGHVRLGTNRGNRGVHCRLGSNAPVRGKISMVVVGGTGTGKTTMLNVLSNFIPEGERLITIEESAELQIQGAHVVTLETRPANAEL